MTNTEIDRIRKLAEAATHGERIACFTGEHGTEHRGFTLHRLNGDYIGWISSHDKTADEQAEATAQLIAALDPQTILAILADNQRLQNALTFYAQKQHLYGSLENDWGRNEDAGWLSKDIVERLRERCAFTGCQLQRYKASDLIDSLREELAAMTADRTPNRGGPRDPVAVWFDRTKSAEAALLAANDMIRSQTEAGVRMQQERDVATAALRAENEALRKDAERWRWIIANDAVVADVTWLDADALDVAIDAALANRPAEDYDESTIGARDRPAEPAK